MAASRARLDAGPAGGVGLVALHDAGLTQTDVSPSTSMVVAPSVLAISSTSSLVCSPMNPSTVKAMR